MKTRASMSLALRAVPIVGLALLSLLFCAKSPEPRGTVVDFLRSIREDTTSADYLKSLLDLDELLTEGSVYKYDSNISLDENRTRFLNLFLPGGKVRTIWARDQVVVGSMDLRGDTAVVEVSFIDREATPVKQYYNKMGVHRIDGRWKLFAFKLF